MKRLLFTLFVLFLIAGCIPHIDYMPLMLGDCVDRAVVIRQDLRERGYEAEITCGFIMENCKPKEGHCWVKYKDKKTDEWKRIDNY